VQSEMFPARHHIHQSRSARQRPASVLAQQEKQGLTNQDQVRRKTMQSEARGAGESHLRLRLLIQLESRPSALRNENGLLSAAQSARENRRVAFRVSIPKATARQQVCILHRGRSRTRGTSAGGF